ncbi:MAG: ribonuclease H-like domain-containing protein [Thermodesulfobacteriota bacterium]
MIRNSFIQVPGVGATTERRLWEAGVLSWDHFVPPYPPFLSGRQVSLIASHLERGRRLCADSPEAAWSLLPARERWRLFPLFRHSVAYLDIETDGLRMEESQVTAISLYDGMAVYTYAPGRNLEHFVEDVERYSLLVTYNGAAFDLPMLRRYFGISLAKPHLDLRPLMQSLGFRGGLKGCEKHLGLDRGELAGVDGYAAVLLWQEYQRTGEARVLETLLAYNLEDTVNLEALLVAAYNLKLADTPFAESHRLPAPPQPPRPMTPHPEVVARVLKYRHRFSAPW